jgi:hypothetical protein
VHTNGLLTFGGWGQDTSGYDEADQQRAAELAEFEQVGGYASIQSTRPQTLAFGLHDSPTGLLAWIVDLFHTFTNPDNKLPEDAVDRDALLTNVTIYWLTETLASSTRIYKESQTWGTPLANSGVPTGCALFPGDSTIRAIAEQQNNVVHWTEYDRGGHFAAMEAPDLLITDIREFFRNVR